MDNDLIMLLAERLEEELNLGLEHLDHNDLADVGELEADTVTDTDWADNVEIKMRRSLSFLKIS